MEERLVRLRPRAVLVIIGIMLAVALVLWLVYLTRGVLLWVLIAAFLAMALNPAVEWLIAHGIRRRGPAVGLVFLGAIGALVAIGFTFVPTLIGEVNDFADAVPAYVDDLTKGEGPLGFLEEDYQIVERVRDAIETSGVSGVLGLSSTAVGVAKSVFTAIIASITIAFLTLFMLFEGPAWMERFYDLLPARRQARLRRIGADVYRAVGGYVVGNLAISLIAGVASAIVLSVAGVPFAFALALIVALLDLVPLAGATIAAVLVTTVAFLDSTTAGIVCIVFFLVYQQLENHVLQPLIYGRTVQLSPLAVLVAVLLGAQLAGVVGALGAIPVAAAIQVVIRDLIAQRDRREPPDAPEPAPA
jgi:predicted PurR-regulated permease PerM